MKTLINKLAEIQKKLNAPKLQNNTFGGYKYRSCEDILVAVKPLLGSLAIIINDDINVISDRVYIKATATITDGEHSIRAAAFAREAMSKKGMDEAQITGSASSYARKYALSGLLLIDDNKDADHHDNSEEKKPPVSTAKKPIAALNLEKACDAIRNAETLAKAEHYADAAFDRATSDQDKKKISEALKHYGEVA